MARKYALIKNSVVFEIVSLEEEAVSDYVKLCDLLIDIEDITPLPAVGWVLEGNSLQIPQGTSSKEEFEINLNARKSEFGTALVKRAVDKIGARNKILFKTGPEVMTLLTALLGVKALMETGALGTARASCAQLKVVYTEYADVFDFVITEINTFEATFGL